jgi:hypothetical protein
MALTLSNPAQLDLTVYRGIDLQPVVVTVTDVNGNPINLTGWSVAFGARKFTGLASITNPIAGQVTIQANRQATKALPVGETPYDLILLSNGGVSFGPFVAGMMTVKETLSPAFP